MLENVTVKQLNDLKRAIGQGRKEISVAATRPGDVIRVMTKPGKMYLFETSSPNQRLAHVYECNPREYTPKHGYQGLKKVLDIALDRQLVYGDSRSDLVTQITFINRSQKK